MSRTTTHTGTLTSTLKIKAFTVSRFPDGNGSVRIATESRVTFEGQLVATLPGKTIEASFDELPSTFNVAGVGAVTGRVILDALDAVADAMLDGDE